MTVRLDLNGKEVVSIGVGPLEIGWSSVEKSVLAEIRKRRSISV